MPAPVPDGFFLKAGLGAEEAKEWTRLANDVLRRHPGASASQQEAAWRDLLVGPLAGRRGPFGAHEALFHWVYRGRDTAGDGPGPAWFPGQDAWTRSNVGRFAFAVGQRDYVSFHRWTADHRDEFWDAFVRRLDVPFRTRPKTVRDPTSPVTRPVWLPGAQFNIADVCFRAAKDKTAILYAHEGEPGIRRITYAELDRLSARAARGLDRLGLHPKDRVALYMPMTPESVAAYLGIVRSGRAAVGVADASAPADVEKRLRISGAKAVITIDAYVRDQKTLRVYEKAKEARAPLAIVVAPEGRGLAASPLRPGDVAWERFLGDASPYASVARTSEDETNILFSSGTTKDPKAIVWTHTTPLKCIMDAHFHQDVQPDDVLAWPTSFGWMMGPWLTYASLAHKATMAIYNGSPLSRSFGEFVEKAGVTMVGVVPKIVRVWKEQRTMEGFDWSQVRRFSSTGETSDPHEMSYLMWLAGNKPIVEYCGGTEIGGGYLTGTMVQPAAPATFTTPSCGLDLHVLDEEGRPAPRGEVALVPPSIGLSNQILNYDHDEEYFTGFFRGPKGETLRRHGDQLERLGGGYFRHHGRMDDMINLNGVKTSVEELRAVILHQPDVHDVKPIAVDVEGKGQRVLVVYAVPKDEARVEDPTLKAKLKQDFGRLIKERLNPLLAHVHDVVVVADLPQAGPGKTRTQKEFAKDYQARHGPHALAPRP